MSIGMTYIISSEVGVVLHYLKCYQVLNQALILLPPIYFMACVSLKRLMTNTGKTWESLHKGKIPIVYMTFLHYIVFFVLFEWFLRTSTYYPMFFSNPYARAEWYTRQFACFFSLFISILAVLLEIRFLKRIHINVSRITYFIKPVCIFLILLHLSFNGYQET